MSDYRKKFLSLWSTIMAEERWHRFESKHCNSHCRGWNSWAPLCDCGSNLCTFKPNGELANMELVIEARPLEF